MGEQYGKIFVVSIMGKKVVFLNDEKLIKKALSSEKFRDEFRERPPTILSEYLFKNEIAFSYKMDEQQAMRKVFHKAMNVYGDGVQMFESVVNTELNVLCRRIEDQNGADFCISDFIKESLSNLISILVSNVFLFYCIVLKQQTHLDI